ncbi:regulator of microtubule dynamics protein 1-like [Mytilus trossulus]|uniref:regulator of microtubule dynamics protein 1-like n=1 Tax=Mytilus trossulus TaxID=6551 RepID=UPI003003F17D
MMQSSLRFFTKFRQSCGVAYRFLRSQRKESYKQFKKIQYSLFPVLAFQPFATVNALSFGFGKKEEVKELTKEELVVIEADKIYTANEILKLYDFLIQYKDCQNDEILWRLARAASDKGKLVQNTNEKKACFFEAFEYVKKALELNDNNFASHKWYAILLDYTAEYEGTKKRISNAFHVKDHLKKANELNPKDATSLYSLGYWCFLFADMPWYMRQIASALFASPPTSTYEEALAYFEKAEEADPNFYSMNLLMLGKTYLRLKNHNMALKYLTRAKDQPLNKPDDEKAHKEALELLKSMGVKLEEQH